MIMPVLEEFAEHGPKDPTKKKSVLRLIEKPAVSKVRNWPKSTFLPELWIRILIQHFK
jgi:hypothetical protein